MFLVSDCRMKMKTKIAIALTALTIGSLFATPLFVLIMQESEKTADAIRAFNKQCAGVDYGADGKRENECRDKREAPIDIYTVRVACD